MGLEQFLIQTKTAVICPIVKLRDAVCSDIEVKNRIEEATGLVKAMGQRVVYEEAVKVSKIAGGSFFGKGTVERLKGIFKETGVELMVVDGTLSAVQQRNLEKALEVKAIDRTAVILEIFGQRAQTKEGKLQVELAHLSYQRGRLVRSWTHLERQRGGGGFLGGPGETQIELDRRFLDNRIIKIKKELEKVKKTRGIQRAARARVPYPQAALVGYTNAGKSSLFNRVCHAAAFAEDMLFATLDPVMRKVKLSTNCEIILSDTVGFISNLPHELVMAFRATLEEVSEADVIVHVIDAANPEWRMQRESVLGVLHELELEKIEHDARRYVEVYNKSDLLNDKEKEALGARLKKAGGVLVSAANGDGVDEFMAVLKEKFMKRAVVRKVKLALSDGKGIAKLYDKAEVLERVDDYETGEALFVVKGGEG